MIAPISMKVADSITAYRIVRISAANTVSTCSATTDGIFGVTQDNCANANQAVAVQCLGVGSVYCNDTLTAGGFVTTDASGRAVPATGSTTGTNVLGRVLETVSATGTIAKVLVNPFVLFDVP
jgi:hypothetical protein